MGASRYLDLINEKVVVYDGAFGTYVQTLDLGPDDFGGEHLEGCNELLVLTRPDVIAEMHDAFFKVGVDVVETATFGAFAVPLAEYDIAEQAHEINLAAARIAREVADGHGGLVAGSMGPGTKFASLGQIRFAELRDAYEEQARGLLEGGVDLLLIETQFDLLGAKAAMIGCRRAMAAAGREVPIQVQVTMELTGTMLPGTEIGAALAALDAMRPDVIGINCATGPAEMSEHLRYLGQHARMPIACLPNAGLPSVVDGKMHYDLTPDQLAEYQSRFVTRLRRADRRRLLRHHRRAHQALVEAVKDVTPAPRTFEHEDGATSIYSFTPFDQQLTYLSIGERTNANGSKKFREAMLDGDWDMCVAMAREQEKEGAHVLDVCVDYVGRDGTADMDEIASRFATQATVPLMIDSTEPQVIETALQWIGGRAILNSVNLEDGDAPGTRLDRFLSLAREYGAAVVCTCIDEEGQARTPEWKLKAAKSIHDIAVDRYGLEPGDLFFDPLALTLGTGMEECAGRRCVHARGHPPHQGEPPRRAHHARPLQHLLRPQPGRPPRPQLRVPPRVRPRPASTRPSCTPPASRRWRASPRSRRRSASTSSTTGAPTTTTRCSSCSRCSRASPPSGREGGPLGLDDREDPLHPHHRRRPRRPHRRPRRRPGRRQHPARHHQRRPPRRHEGRRRPLRQGRDAAAVRAAVRRRP